ncbi:GlsB/YeaQ/YmgE family stress response membrane protein [Bradyrhizobium sp. B124]|uniref:GlsB/YeaQ/YmgE family stress response membrane protein n=1 Tax=Bradyrhizobium sp. B124 TaxID=3140245 RepID=UPI00318386FA
MNMSGESLLVILVVGVAAGWLAGQLVRGTGFGLVGDLIVGIAGAFIASWLFPQLGIHFGLGIVSAIMSAAIGAVLLLLIIRLVRGRSRSAGGWDGPWRRRWW